MTFDLDFLEVAHRHSSNHRVELERSDLCGCFHCRSTFPPANVREWVDDGGTALCPECGIDSVIGSASGFPVAEAGFLAAMNRLWF